MDRNDTPAQPDTPTPTVHVPGLEGPSTADRCLSDYREAAERRANGQH